MAEEFEKNTRGLAVVLRFAGVLLPLAALLGISVAAAAFHWTGAGRPAVLAGVYKVIAFLWAWPYRMYDEGAFGFGSMALVALVMAGVLWARRDWRGAVTVIVWALFCGWLISAIIGQAQGN